MFSSHTQQLYLSEVMDMFINLIVVIVSRCARISHYHAVHLKYIQIYLSIKLGKETECLFIF